MKTGHGMFNKWNFLNVLSLATKMHSMMLRSILTRSSALNLKAAQLNQIVMDGSRYIVMTDMV